jgi:hypothetical protein
MTLNERNNISENGRNNYVFHSATGGTIENNLSYRKLGADFGIRGNLISNPGGEDASVASTEVGRIAPHHHGHAVLL